MNGNHIVMKLALILLAIVGITVSVTIVAVVIISMIVFLGGWSPRLGTRGVTKDKDRRHLSKMNMESSTPDALGKQR